MRKWERFENKIRIAGDTEFDNGVIAYVADRIDATEQQRNGDVLAAAPEMLEALKQSREILEQTHTGKGYDMLYVCERLAMAISTMSLAITQAEGSK